MTVLSALVLKALFRSTSAAPGDVDRQRSEARPRRRVTASSAPKAEPTRGALTLPTKSDSKPEPKRP